MRLSRPNGLWPIVLVGLVLRLGWSFHEPADDAGLAALPDQVEYLSLGRNLLSGQGLQFYDARFGQNVWAYRMPGYPVFVALCGGDVRVIRSAQAVVDAGTIVAVFLLARVWLSARGSLGAAALVALNPLMIYFSALVLSETLFTAMLAWGMVLFAWKGRAPLAGCMVLALAVMVRPSAMLLGPVLAVSALREKRNAVAAAVISFGLTLALLAVWAGRNQQRLGTAVWTTTNEGITRYDGFNPLATGASDQSFVGAMPELENMDEVRRSQYLNDKADEYIRRNPAHCCVGLTLKKLGRFWSPVPLSREYRRPIYWAVGLGYTLPLMILALVGAVRPGGPGGQIEDPHPGALPEYPARGEAGGLAWRVKIFLLTPALYFTVIHVASVSSLRYRLPAEPLLAILAASAPCKKR